MKNKVLEMFKKSFYDIHEGRYVYAKLANEPMSKNYFMISKDNDEITILTKEEYLIDFDILERNSNSWILISLNLAVPFMAGTIAIINMACAKHNLNNLIVSTYSKDYILVKETQLEEIKKILNSLGFKLKIK